VERRAVAAEVAERMKAEGGLVRWPEVPLVHMRVPVPRVPIAHPGALLAQTRWAAQTARSMLPSAERIAYYGGLGALAIAGVLEWPVAAVMGAGVWIASHTGQRGDGRRRSEGGQMESETRRPARAGRARPRAAT
jgi:hypothetical protein